jgi:polysaccharide biosynthesis transport protein
MLRTQNMNYLYILWKRRCYGLGVFFLVASGTAIYAVLTSDMYKSEIKVVAISEGIIRPSTPEGQIATIRMNLSSRTFLERMIEQMQMYGYGARTSFVMDAAVKTAQKQIGIEKTSSYIFTISFTASNPQLAQTVTRQLAQELIRISTHAKMERVLVTDQFFNEQLQKTGDEIAAQEEKIKQFKTAYLAELPEQANIIINSLSKLHSRLAMTENAIRQAQERRKMLDFQQAEHQRLRWLSKKLATTKDGARNALTSLEKELAAKRALLVRYLALYPPNHPEMRLLKKDIESLEGQVKNQKAQPESTTEPPAPLVQPQDEEAKKTPSPDQTDPLAASFKFEEDSIKAEIARRENEKQEIRQQIKLLQSRLNLAPAREQQLSVLMREWSLMKTQFDKLQKQEIRIKMQKTSEADIKNETFRIIDEANLPVKAEYPYRLQIILMGIGGGLLLGIAAAFIREILAPAITPAAIQR